MHTAVDNDGSFYLCKRLLTYVRPYWLILVVGLISTMLFAGIDALAAYMLKPFINRGFIARDIEFIRWVPFVILIAFLFRGVMNFLSVYCMAWVGRTVVMDLRQQMFQKFQRLPAYYYDKSSSGKLLSKLLYDVEQVAQASTDAMTTFVQSSCFVVGLIIVMFNISWRLSLLFFITTPVILLIVQLTNQRVRRFSYIVQKTMGRVTEIAEESIEGYREVRVFGAQQHQDNKFKCANEESRRSNIKSNLARAYSVSGVQFIAAFNIAIIIYLAINPKFSTLLSAGGFSAMVVSMVALLKPLKNFSRVNARIQMGLAGARSIFSLYDTAAEKDTGEQTLEQCQGTIEFSHISFSYCDETVLKDLSFTIKPGETIALVGCSGSGKTTLASLIMRFYDVQEGDIFIDSVNIRDIALTSLRKQIALVSQQVVLFNGTVWENITFGLEGTISKEEVYHAAQLAHALEFIAALPKGFDTVVGDNGALLSGGQRQRIAIARAILKNAPILILDEATSSLDTQSEKHIQSALDIVMHNRTTLVIAHRLSTIENADRILVLDEGRIVEMGKHQELLNKGSHYAKLHATQFRDPNSPIELAS